MNPLSDMVQWFDLKISGVIVCNPKMTLCIVDLTPELDSNDIESSGGHMRPKLEVLD